VVETSKGTGVVGEKKSILSGEFRSSKGHPSAMKKRADQGKKDSRRIGCSEFVPFRFLSDAEKNSVCDVLEGSY